MVESPSTLRPSRGGSVPTRPETVAIFARQVLVFPLLVVLLACTSFLFGGRCAAWQWWTAVASVVLVPFARRSQWRAALRTAGLFALLLFALRCLIPPLGWDDTTCPDMPVYHLPMVQLLIEGWNPVADPMAENITTSLGLDLWGMAPLHVAFLPKTLAAFSAVAFTFVDDPYALTFPLPVFLWLGVLLQAFRTFRGFPRLALSAAIVGILPIVTLQMPVDLCVAFSSCGLLLTMLDALRRRKCDWLALAIWTAWMMNLKLNGVLGAFVFCAAFAAATIWRNRTEWRKWLGRFAAFAGVLVLLWALVSWNPLGTSWQTFGHPLYPFKTIDAKRFPVMDLTWDIRIGNRDLQRMNKLGRFVHAYISPRTTVAFYRWHLNRPDFEPVGIWWGWREFPTGIVRLAICLAFGILFVLPAGRLWGMAGLVLMAAVPNDVVGFTRYQPWLSALGCLAVALLGERIGARVDGRPRKVLAGLFLAGIALFVLYSGQRRAPEIECKAAERRTIHPLVRSGFWLGPIEQRKQLAPFVRNFVPRYNYLKSMENHCRLLLKQSGLEGVTTIEPADGIARMLGLEWEWDERKWLPGFERFFGDEIAADVDSRPPNDVATAASEQRSEKRSWVAAPFGYWAILSPETDYLDRYYLQTHTEGDNGEDGGRPSLPIGDILHAWFVTYPREVWSRL